MTSLPPSRHCARLHPSPPHPPHPHTDGGREFDPQARRLHAESGLPVRPIRGLDVDTPMLGATVKNWFTLGLSRAYFESDPFTYRDSQENSWLIAEFDVAAYVRNINAGTQIQNSRWFGYSTINETVFASTLGLLGFSAFLQVRAVVCARGGKHCRAGAREGTEHVAATRISLGAF